MHLLLAGNHGQLRHKTEELFTRICRTDAAGFTWAAASDFAAVTEADAILLFAGSETMDDLVHLLNQIRQLDGRPTGGVLLLSDNSVYGKYFGPQEPRREHEMGYACHVSAQDRPAAMLRMAEHTAWRMAHEHQMKIVIARGDQNAEGAELETMIWHALLALQNGTAGEAYNLPTGQSGTAGEAYDLSTEQSSTAGETCNLPESSPLSPNPIWTDTDKIKQIIRLGEKHVTA
jgi:hypothetical protein